MEYKTYLSEAVSETEIKRSRFIAYLNHVESAAEAEAILEKLKKEHWKANHVCYGYVLGVNSETMKFSDAGEPSGTAGKPILSSLTANGLTFVLGSVVRYFGGIKLGAGGLTRAYASVMGSCLEKCVFSRMVYCPLVTVEAAYSDYGRIDALVNRYGLRRAEMDFADEIRIGTYLPEESIKPFLDAVSEATGGSYRFEQSEGTFIEDTRQNV
ncbi:MAG: YigZ family protein [Eubacteriales bacterium]|nr:YigZ family protein [Eubacteriales bacterium]